MATLNMLTARGTIYLVTGKGTAKYKIEPSLFEAGEPDNPDYAILFTGYTFMEQEVVAKVSCLNDQRVMYSFGKGFGDLSILGEVLCGNYKAAKGAEKVLSEYYEENRVHSLEAPIKFSGPENFAKEFYLVGMQIMQYNTAYEILSFRLNGVLAE